MEFSGLKQETEMAHGKIGGQQLPVERRILLLGWRQLGTEE
jgi:hypothetical protein